MSRFVKIFVLGLVVGACSRREPPPPPVPAGDPFDRLREMQRAHRADLEARASAGRAKLVSNPSDLDAALSLSRTLIELSRITPDRSLLDEAERSIAPFPAIPEAMVIGATIKQSRHDFDGAIKDLERALTAKPTDAQAWLTLSSVLLVRGQFIPAMHACKPLAALSGPLASAGCEASVMSVGGQAAAAIDRLFAVLQSAQQRTPAERAWAYAIAGEAASRIGDVARADEAFKAGLATGARDGYLLAAYADHLLDQQRYREVLDLTAREIFDDALLLRRTIAERALSAPDYAKHLAALQAVFDAGLFDHSREIARFHLELTENSTRALQLAKDNWAIQREPWDTRLLLAAALAGKDKAAAAPAIAFVQKSKLEGQKIHALIDRLKALPNSTGTDALIAAARAAGIEVSDPEMGLGESIGAASCATATTKSGVGVALCEFADEKSVASGKEMSQKKFGAVPDRVFYVRKNLLLMLRQIQKTEQAQKDAAALAEIFSKL